MLMMFEFAGQISIVGRLYLEILNFYNFQKKFVDIYQLPGQLPFLRQKSYIMLGVFWINELLPSYQECLLLWPRNCRMKNTFVVPNTLGKHLIIVALKSFCCIKFKTFFVSENLIFKVGGLNFSNLGEIWNLPQCFPHEN